MTRVAAATEELLVEGVTKRFYGIAALEDVSFAIAPGELVGLIGPNGSGKTTLFNCLTGYLRPERGRIMYRNTDITRLSPHHIAMAGIGRTFQAALIFPRLSVLDHLLVAQQEFHRDTALERLVRTRRARRFEAVAEEKAYALLQLVGLAVMSDRPVTHLSYGQRKLLALAMALATDPNLLLLDEPVAGVNPVLVQRLMDLIRELHNQGRTIVLIEHNMRVVMQLCERVIVLDHGRKIAEGSPWAVREDPQVVQVFFGR